MAVTDPAIERYRLHAELCKVLTDPKRLMLLDALRDGARSVGELAEAIEVTLANASQHLAVMRAAGLVEGHRVATTVHYRLAEPEILAACGIVGGIVQRRLDRSVGPALGAPPRSVRATPATTTTVTG